MILFLPDSDLEEYIVALAKGRTYKSVFSKHLLVQEEQIFLLIFVIFLSRGLTTWHKICKLALAS